MEQHWKQLAQGVELAVNRTDKFKTGLLCVTFTIPLRQETATAGALIPEVLCRGSRRYPDMERISMAADERYGAAFSPGVRQRGESQCISLLCSFIDDCYALDGAGVLEPVAELMGQVLLDPMTEGGVFLREYVESEGANLADRIRARINDKRSWAMFRLIQEMCAGEAYAVDKLGDEEKALSATPEWLWKNYQWLLDQGKVTFYYGGSASLERVEETVRTYFAPLLRDRMVTVDCQVVEKPGAEVNTVTDTMEVTQGKLSLGFRTGGITMGSPQYPALLVCNALYGGSSHSKLFLNVREKMSLCYYASSMVDKLKGIMVAASGVEFAQFDRAQTAMLDQMEAIRQGQFTQEELRAAVGTVANSLRSRLDSQGQMEDDCLTQLLFGGGMCQGQDLLQAVERVTAGQVAQVAQGIRLDTVYRLIGKEGAAHE